MIEEIIVKKHFLTEILSSKGENSERMCASYESCHTSCEWR
jgi:hypothetical protein